MKREALFEEAVRANIAALSAYARSAARDQWTADEAIQETLIRAWRYWPTFRQESHVLTWLITICRRVIIDLASRAISHEEIGLRELAIPTSSPSIGLQEMIADLPLSQREVVVLCSVIGFDYETTAEILEVPVGTVKSRLSRARQSLASQMSSDRRDAI